MICFTCGEVKPCRVWLAQILLPDASSSYSKVKMNPLLNGANGDVTAVRETMVEADVEFGVSWKDILLENNTVLTRDVAAVLSRMTRRLCRWLIFLCGRARMTLSMCFCFETNIIRWQGTAQKRPVHLLPVFGHVPGVAVASRSNSKAEYRSSVACCRAHVASTSWNLLKTTRCISRMQGQHVIAFRCRSVVLRDDGYG